MVTVTVKERSTVVSDFNVIYVKNIDLFIKISAVILESLIKFNVCIFIRNCLFLYEFLNKVEENYRTIQLFYVWHV